MTVRVESAFPGRLASFADVRALAERFGTATGVDHDTTLRLVLILEELFTNTVTHGYPVGAEGPIWVALATRDRTIEVTYEDAAPPFDPFAEAPWHREPAPTVDASVIGGLGLRLVWALSMSACYARVADRNRVVLTIASSDPAPP